MTITAQIALNSGKINVEFNVVFNETGDQLRASVPFSSTVTCSIGTWVLRHLRGR